MLLHRVAFRILHACSVVFMIMRFPLRVLAIGGVEAGSGKGGRHVSVFFALSVSPHHPACSAVISVWRNLKNIGERKLAGLKNLCGRMYDCGSKHSGAWNGIHGMAHERGVEKASQRSSLRHRHSLGG